MDIIIRSQDKTNVYKIKHIGYGSFYDHNFVVDDNCIDDRIVLGEYATKERCIEIINDIYNQITQAIEHGDSVVIYSMPKE